MNILESHIEGAHEWPLEERGMIYCAIVEYMYYGTEPDYLSGGLLGYFIAIRPTLDKSRARALAGRRGGTRAPGNADAGAMQRPSNAVADAKQDASKAEANAKQTQGKNHDTCAREGSGAVGEEVTRDVRTSAEIGSDKCEDKGGNELPQVDAQADEANAKQTPSKRQARREAKRKQTAKQTPSDSDSDSEYKNNTPIAPTAECVEVIAHLNERARKNFKVTSKQTLRLVSARLADGYTVADLIRVVDVKCEEWLGTGMETYLRPSTLFSAGHFDEYLNQADRPAAAARRGGGGGFADYAD